jgi:DNA-binding protein HU-beta
MNKGDLIDKMAKDAGVTKAAAGDALNAFMDAVKSTLQKGDKVTLVGFGTFSVSKRSARTGRNPQTGKEIKIAAKVVAKFKAGADLSASAAKAKIK